MRAAAITRRPGGGKGRSETALMRSGEAVGRKDDREQQAANFRSSNQFAPPNHLRHELLPHHPIISRPHPMADLA
jgi:hypothetical protein